MGKKRKQFEIEAPEAPKKYDVSPPRPKQTLLGWKEKIDEKETDSPVFRNREKILVTCSRRIVYIHRHLMLDVVSLLPHCKKDNKVESKESKGAALNELVDLKNCKVGFDVLYKCRKQKDLYLWMAKCPKRPSVKFLVNAELKLTGNHLKGSRPILSFSTNFDEQSHRRLLKELIMQITVPHKETDKVDRGGLYNMTLVEVGPRFCLNPIKIFGGSFGGPTLYVNPYYVSPNQIRALEKKKKAGKYAKKIKAKT